MGIISARLLVAVTAAASACVLAAAPASAATPASSSPWHVALKVSGSSRQFTAVTAISTRDAWAFYISGSRADAYQLSGSAWHKRAFPSGDGSVISASASSSANVWAFTERTALRYNGTSWSALKKFGYITSGLAISKTDVWVFGGASSSSQTTSAWNYNGATWTKVASGSGLYGGYALSPSSVWAYGRTTVAHWNGRSWAKASVARLLPKKTDVSISTMSGIYAASGHSVYGLGTGGAETVGGPIVLLHYNGKAWSKIKVARVQANPQAIVPDGKGGLWIPRNKYTYNGMERYSRGKLTSSALPYSSSRIELAGIAHMPDSTSTLVIGTTRRSATNFMPTGIVILRYRG